MRNFVCTAKTPSFCCLKAKNCLQRSPTKMTSERLASLPSRHRLQGAVRAKDLVVSHGVQRLRRQPSQQALRLGRANCLGKPKLDSNNSFVPKMAGEKVFAYFMFRISNCSIEFAGQNVQLIAGQQCLDRTIIHPQGVNRCQKVDSKTSIKQTSQACGTSYSSVYSNFSSVNSSCFCSAKHSFLTLSMSDRVQALPQMGRKIYSKCQV